MSAERVVGAFDAKTHLSHLLDRVEKGESITITRHGAKVARLVPEPRDREHVERAVEELRAFGKGRHLPAGLTIHDLISDRAGRPDSDLAATLDLSLPESMLAFVETVVQRGSFTSASEYVRALIRERMADEERDARNRDLASRLFGSTSSSDEARRLLEVIELFEAGVKLTEERLRRQFPDATAADIARHLADWLQRRGEAAESGDGPGRPVSAERMRRLRGG